MEYIIQEEKYTQGYRKFNPSNPYYKFSVVGGQRELIKLVYGKIPDGWYITFDKNGKSRYNSPSIDVCKESYEKALRWMPKEQYDQLYNFCDKMEYEWYLKKGERDYITTRYQTVEDARKGALNKSYKEYMYYKKDAERYNRPVRAPDYFYVFKGKTKFVGAVIYDPTRASDGYWYSADNMKKAIPLKKDGTLYSGNTRVPKEKKEHTATIIYIPWLKNHVNIDKKFTFTDMAELRRKISNYMSGAGSLDSADVFVDGKFIANIQFCSWDRHSWWEMGKTKQDYTPSTGKFIRKKRGD